MNKINEFGHLNPKMKNYKRSDVIIEITDPDGNVAYASDQKTAADALSVTASMISAVLNDPSRCHSVRGCTLRRVDSLTLKPIEK